MKRNIIPCLLALALAAALVPSALAAPPPNRGPREAVLLA